MAAVTTAQRVLDLARAELGTVEAGDGSTRYHRAYGLPFSQPWCAVFTWWLFQQAKAPQLTHPKTAYTPTLADWYRARGAFSANPMVGDLVFYDWPDSIRRIQHVGIVEAVEPGAIVAIEGNTSRGTAGSQSNGGGVWRRRRARNSSIVGYGHPAYSDSPGGAAMPRRLLKVTDPFMRGDDVRTAQAAAGVPVAERDGVYGPGTAAYMRAFQLAQGLTPDGEVGPKTWMAIDAATAPSPPAPPKPPPAPPRAPEPAPAGDRAHTTWRHDGGPDLTAVDLLRSLDRELNSRLPLADRPGPDTDSLYGHVLSMRAELRAFRDDTTSRLARLAQTGGLPAAVAGLDAAALRALAVAVVDEQGRRLTPPAA